MQHITGESLFIRGDTKVTGVAEIRKNSVSVAELVGHDPFNTFSLMTVICVSYMVCILNLTHDLFECGNVIVE